MTSLPATPQTLGGPEGLDVGLWAGSLRGADALPRLPGRGRTRSWSYAAAATVDGELAFGAAIVHLGVVASAFAWLVIGGDVHTWDRRLPGFRADVADAPDQDSRARHGRDRLTITRDGGIAAALDDVAGRPLHVDLTTVPGRPVVCATPTPAGGFNVTQKAAGHRTSGTIAFGDDLREVVGHGWSDWTRGRQDRRTSWQWAAGAGKDVTGRTVGLNVSTGMNASGPGEDVVWVDGEPHALEVEQFGPLTAGEFAGPWGLAGAGWSLRFEPVGIRSADENLVVVRSRYVQPYGIFSGTLPGPGGTLIELQGMPGVTEDHEALW